LSDVAVVIVGVDLSIKGRMVWFKSLSMFSDLMLFIIIPIVSVVDVVAGLVTLELVGEVKLMVDTV
jgi:hypothetical protein